MFPGIEKNPRGRIQGEESRGIDEENIKIAKTWTGENKICATPNLD
jgi:hypothetical protein